MPSMKVMASPRLGTGPVQWPPGSPGSGDQGSGFHTRGPGRSGYPPGRAAGEPGLVIVSLIRSLKAPRRAGGGGHLLRGHKLLLWRRRDCFFTQSRCFQHASSSVGNLVQ